MFDDYEAPSGSAGSVQVSIDGTDRTDTTAEASEVEKLVAPIGVEECAELKTEVDGQPDIFFTWGNASPANVDDQRLREFDASLQSEPVCRRGDNQDQSGCSRISEGESDSVTVSESTSGPPMQVGFTFPALMTYRDGQMEECAFRGSAGMQQTSDAGLSDAGVMSDAGSVDSGASGGDLPDIIYNARLFLNDSGGSGSVVPVDAALYLDRTRPPEPQLLSAQATQNQIQYEIQRPSSRTNDVEAFWLFYSNDPISQGDAGEEFFEQGGVSQRTLGEYTTDSDNAGESFTDSVSVSLTSGNTVYVGVATRDKAENFSVVGTTGESLTVAQERGFGDVYMDSGGSERGGCGCASSTPGVPLSPLVGLVCVVGLGCLRRRLRLAALLAVVGIVFVAAPASAQTDINGNFELRFGPYYPSVDSEFGGDAQPFQELFGSNGRIMGELKFDKYVYDGHGKLGVGGTIGYTNFTGDAQITTLGGGDSPDIDAETKLQLLPLRAQVFYRWDFLQQRFDVPIVPRLEAGLDWYMWRIRDGNGNTATFGEGGPKAQGATAGYHGSAGLEVNLNPIDPKSAATFDYTWGVNRTYLFALYEFAQVNDFGGEGFNLSDQTWKVGLAFEF
jgi:hypothetical protein